MWYTDHVITFILKNQKISKNLCISSKNRYLQCLVYSVKINHID